MTEEEIETLAKTIKRADLSNETLSGLAFMLNDINKAIDSLTIQYNMVCREIKRRLPKLNDDINLEDKKKWK